MDNLAHSLFGAHLARLPLLDRPGPKLALWTALIASNLPDADLVLRLFGEQRYVFEHRGLTHSLLGILVQAPLVALVVTLVARRPLRATFPPLLALSLAALVGHVFLDLPTSWGTMLLAPFDWTRFATDWVFIVDIFFWGILGIPLLVGYVRRRRGAVPVAVRRRTSIASLFALALYVMLCGNLHERARRVALEVHRAETPTGARPSEVLAYPAPFGPFLWTTLVREGETTWHRAFVSALTGGSTQAGSFATGADDPRVQVAIETEPGARYRAFAAALYRVEATPLRPDGSYKVVLGDLRFSIPLSDEAPFQFALEIDGDFTARTASLRSGPVAPSVEVN